MVKKYATMASVFALGVVLGMICLSTLESEGLNGSSVLKTIAPSKGHSKARYSAGCYGDSSLCAALLTARNGKEFQRLLSSMRMPAGRKLFATGLGAPKVGTKPLLAKSARAQGSRNVPLQCQWVFTTQPRLAIL